MMYVQTAAKTNQTALTCSPRTTAIIDQPTAPRSAMRAKTIFSLPVMRCGARTATGGRSGSVRTRSTPSRISTTVSPPAFVPMALPLLTSM